MNFTVGSRLESTTCTTQVIVVCAPGSEEIDLRCGGHPMAPLGEALDKTTPDEAFAQGTLIGKRYVHDSGLELLCTKAGVGALAVAGDQLSTKDAKPLPASD
jgi:hypothetical protein